ncbi:MAG TPA: metal ABC transporter permease [Candidatus Babeliales bacterium]|nr:metal ABC transporter permease [Candidatus Babeliales bacterium]
MNIVTAEILAIAALATIACTTIGTFLILRDVALMSDAISHAVLPGIVIMFLFVKKLDSPLLIIGASLAGIATVLLTELIIQSKRLKKDAALGFVFSLFFSVGILLICKYTRNVHLDTDMVILGELAFTPFTRLVIAGHDYGPSALWSMISITLANLTFIICFYKELLLTTFDATFARTVHCNPTTLYYAIMILASITAVGSFHLVGSIVVVTLMLAPAATAYLLTTRLSSLLFLSCALGTTATLIGYLLAHWADVSLAGSIATVHGCMFLCSFLFAPQKGILHSTFFHRAAYNNMLAMILCTYLIQHKDKYHSATTIAQNLNWSHTQTTATIEYALSQQLILKSTNVIAITDYGIAATNQYCKKI